MEENPYVAPAEESAAPRTTKERLATAVSVANAAAALVSLALSALVVAAALALLALRYLR